MAKNDICCAPACTNNRKRNPELKFYRIPKEKNRRKLWSGKIRRQNFELNTENTRLCSAHFTGGKKSDDPKEEAFVPSVFDHCLDLKKHFFLIFFAFESQGQLRLPRIFFKSTFRSLATRLRKFEALIQCSRVIVTIHPPSRELVPPKKQRIILSYYLLKL
jgi:hypothetical protein